MSQRNLLAYFILLLMWGSSSIFNDLSAQNLTVQDATEAPFTPENLISNFFLGDGVEVIDIQYEGAAEAVGFFSNGNSTIGIDRGILMTTGVARTQNAAVGADSNSEEESGGSTEMGVTDLDVTTIVSGTAVFDVAKYTIQFTPVADTLRFRYSFASEEYPEFVCSDYNDIFGFFISGPGINGPFQDQAENIALIPGTDLPVRINNVNQGAPGDQGPNINNCLPPEGSLSFSDLYNETPVGAQPVYDGFTDVFEAVIVLTPCETYTLKLVIADVNDSTRDSGVFLEAKSFGTGSLDVRSVTVGGDGILTEGCTDGEISFSLDTPVESDYTFSFTTFGTADYGTDYNNIPTELTIPAGESTVTIDIEAFEDDMEEGLESIFLDVQLDVCNRDTFELFIRDNQLKIPELRDTVICTGESVELNGDLNATFPPNPTFEWEGTLPINPSNTAIYVPLEVNDIYPRTVSEGVIESICIDSLLHFTIEDMDVYLVAPSGQFMELTTDNGGNGGNGNGPDYYIGTCFTEGASADIRSGSQPFRGNWQPEGEFSDIYGSPTNGTWQLLLVDDKQDNPIFTGILFNWSITFSSNYEIDYSWSPATGLSCTDCPNPVASPSSTTIYTYQVSDSRGCSDSDEIEVSIGGSLPAPVVDCGTITDTEIEITFGDVPGASGYEVNVDGSGWIPVNGNLSHTESGVTPGQEVVFQVRGINNCGGSDIGTTTCQTISCIPPTVSIDNIQDVSCNGESDGELSVSATGGMNGTYNFSLNGESNTSGIFSDLPVGTYELIVFEMADCADTSMITIGEPAELLASTTPLRATLCNGGSGGSASVTVNGGNYPYFYEWPSGETDSIALNLDAGMNEVTITDANDCEQVVSVIVEQPDPIILTTDISDITCNGASDGRITVSPSGGTEGNGYFIFWDENANSSTEATISNLSPGTYRVSVTDENGCTEMTSATVSEPDALELSTTTTDASCSGNLDGTASVQVSGGSGSYTYLWNDDAMQTTATANGLTVGDYDVIVTDVMGMCSDTITASVTSPNAIVVNQQVQPTQCIDTNDGELELIISGGSPDYRIVWDDDPSRDPIRADLAAGLYQATVSDANNCFEVVQVLVPAPDSITYDIFSTENSCQPQDDGTATVNATGGTGSLLYQWDDNQMQQSSRAFQLAAGNYSVTIIDENMCTAIASVEVEDAPPIVLVPNSNDVNCFGESSGFAEVTASGGIGELTYQWVDLDNETSNRVNGLPAGTYRIIVSDDLGCNEGLDIVINEPAQLTSTSSVSTTSCDGEPNGDASVVASGGTEPYTYRWSDSNNQTSSTATGLAPQTYFVTVTDANNCSIIDTVDVAVPERLSVTLSSTEASCGEAADGSVSAIADGGAGGYSYLWSDGIDPSMETVNNLPIGNYTVTVTDANGCTVTQSIAITEAAAFTVSTTVTDVNCIDSNSGAIDITVNDAVEPLSFNWSTGAATEDITDLQEGEQSGTITDANGCQVIVSATVQPAPEIETQYEINDATCNGLSDGSISITSSGSNGGYYYEWEDANNDSIRTNISAGLYAVEVLDREGCRAQDTIRVNEPDSVLVLLTTEPISCFGDQDGLIIAAGAGGTPRYTFSFENQTFDSRNAFTNLSAGTYSIVAQDQNSCFSEPTEITIEQPEELTVSIPDNLIFELGDSSQLSPKINGGTGDLIYSWSPADSTLLSCLDCPDPIVKATFQTSFRLTVIDENNCRARAGTTVIVTKDRKVFVPTGFTPNTDGKNDKLVIHGEEETTVKTFRVFDRWGELVYQQDDFMVNDLKIGWDGNFRNQEAPAGVYVWYLEVEFVDGVSELYKGETTLIR